MSALAGIFSRDGAPIEARSLSALADATAQIGPDGCEVHRQPSVALLFRAFHTTAESRQAQQPRVRQDGSCITWNGRLDNGDELRRRLSDVGPASTEIDLVWAAYREWGAEGFSHLLGDFSLALWDAPRRRLVLATDAFSIRPIFYHCGSRHLTWASRARAVLRSAGLPPEVDEEFVAAFLTTSEPSQRSAFRHVKMVPGGHALVIEPGSEPRLVRYWEPDPHNRIRYNRDEEYEDHFRHIFRSSVAARLRADGPVYAELSGGLDSSSIVCMADRILEAGEATATDLRTVSWINDGDALNDEYHYIELVERQRGRTGIHLTEEGQGVLAIPDDEFEPDYPHGQIAYLARNDQMYEQMQARGARVLLRGFAGDQVLWGEIGGTPRLLADLVVQRRFGRLWRDGRRWARALRQPLHQTLWLGAVVPFLSRRRQVASLDSFQLEEWFDPEFRRRRDLLERVAGPEEDTRFPLPSQRRLWLVIQELTRDIGWEVFLTSGCIEARFPFLDRRLVEFALAVPADQLLRPGETRSILRRALQGTLPEPIRTRTTKGSHSGPIYRALSERWLQLAKYFEDPAVERHGFIQRGALEATLRRVRHGAKVVGSQLVRTLCLEVWLQSLREESRDVSPAQPIREAAKVAQLA